MRNFFTTENGENMESVPQEAVEVKPRNRSKHKPSRRKERGTLVNSCVLEELVEINKHDQAQLNGQSLCSRRDVITMK